MPPTLVLVVPCFNEEARLDVRAFLDFAASRPAVRLTFVDDGSGDRTPGILDGLRAQAPDAVDVIHLPANQGKAAAVREGILAGLRREPDLVGFWDADLATPLSAVDDFLALASKRPEIDIILGSRVMLMGRDIRREAWRHYLGRVFATGGVAHAGPAGVRHSVRRQGLPGERGTSPRCSPSRFTARGSSTSRCIARYLALPRPPDSPDRRDRIYELAVPQWHHIPGSKLRWTDYVRAIARTRRHSPPVPAADELSLASRGPSPGNISRIPFAAPAGTMPPSSEISR
ncbi:MAG: glycosyltransferase [Comamonadaceae bacterium]|nr:glycosyltransferase [Comamonadaceae bacterium]